MCYVAAAADIKRRREGGQGGAWVVKGAAGWIGVRDLADRLILSFQWLPCHLYSHLWKYGWRVVVVVRRKRGRGKNNETVPGGE